MKIPLTASLFVLALTAFPVLANFTNQTNASGISGVNHSTGAAWGDYDNDGDIDLYVAIYGGQDKLYRNNGNGTFTDITAFAGLGHPGMSSAAAWADIDKDGYTDLFVAADSGADLLYKNNGNATFTNITFTSGIGTAKNSKSASWGDYDSDGFVDLYIAVENGSDALFKNNGDRTFTNVAHQAGIDNPGMGVSSAWGDYDNDGDLDLYVVNLFPAWQLFANNGDGTFSDVSSLARVGKTGYASSVNWADYDNDGDLDLYVTVLGSPNVLFHNNGDGTFSEMVSAGVSNAGFDWGASFADYDLDGDLDIYIAIDGNNFLYQNDGSGSFSNVGSAENANHTDVCVNPIWGDYDGDGDLDLFITTVNTQNILYRNEANNAGSSLRIIPLDDKSGNNGFGSLVKVYRTGTSTLLGTRLVDGGSGFGGQGEYGAHFGIPADAGNVDVEVIFSGGYRADKFNTPSLGNIPATGQSLTVRHPDVFPPLNRITLSAAKAGPNSIALNWDASPLYGTDADSVLIRMSDTHFPMAPYETGTVLKGIFPLSISYDSLINAINFKTYYFSLFVRDSAGNWSDAPATARDSVTIFNRGQLSLVAGGGNANLGGSTLRGGDSISVMQFTLRADKIEEIFIDSIFLATSGTMGRIKEAVLIRDVNSNSILDSGEDVLLSTSRLYPGENIKIAFNDRIPPDSTHTYLVLIHLDTLLFSPSDTLRFTLAASAVHAHGSSVTEPSPIWGTPVVSPPLVGKKGSLSVSAVGGSTNLGGRLKSEGDIGIFMHFTATADSVEPVRLGFLPVTLTTGDPRVLEKVILAEDRDKDGKWNPATDQILGSGSVLYSSPPKALINPLGLVIMENESRDFFILGKSGNYPFYQEDSLKVRLDPPEISAKGSKSALLLPAYGVSLLSAVLTGHIDTTAPPALTGLMAQGKSQNEIFLSWDTVKTPDADSLAIRYAENRYPTGLLDGILWKRIDAKETTQIITGLHSDKQYYFALFVKDKAGNWSRGAYAIAKTTDSRPPIITIRKITSSNRSPELSGTIDDAGAGVIVTVEGRQYAAAVNDSVWIIPANTVKPLEQGVYDLMVSAADSLGNEVKETSRNALTIEFNDPPVFIELPDSLRAKEGREFYYRIRTADADSGDRLTLFLLPVGDNLGWLTLDGMELKGKPENDHVGYFPLTLAVSDGRLADTAVIVMEVKNSNDPPRFLKRPDTLIAYEDQEFSFNLTVADPDNPLEELEFILPKHAWLKKSGALVLRGTPDNTHVGTSAVRLVVTDGELADTLSILVIVRNINDAPVITGLIDIAKTGQIWKEDEIGSFKIKLQDIDSDDDIHLDTVGLPGFIRLAEKIAVGDKGNFEFNFRTEALQKDTGRHELNIRFRDREGAEALFKADVRILEVNDMPVSNLEYRLSGGAVRLFFSVNDEDGTLEETQFHYWLKEEKSGLLASGSVFKSSLDFYPLLDGDYVAGVQAEDGHNLKQKDTTLIHFEVKGISSMKLDSGVWVMKSLLQDYELSNSGGSLHVAKWLDNAANNKLYSRYVMEGDLTTLVRGEGYWFLPDESIALKGAPDTSDLKPFEQKLLFGGLGWNQVGNPFPYRINVAEMNLTFWKWNPLSADVEQTTVLEPRGAYWIQVPKPASITLKPIPYFGDNAMAKVQAKNESFLHWTGRLKLEAGRYKDESNLFGVRTGSPKIGESISEPPKIGRYISLFFIHENESGIQRLATDFRPGMAPQGEWWEFGIQNAGTGLQSAIITMEGLAFLNQQGFKSYLVNKGNVVELKSDEPMTIALTNAENYYQLIVSNRPDLPEHLKTGFTLGKNFPNPVEYVTTVRYSLPWQYAASGRRMSLNYPVSITLRDVLGRNAAELFNGKRAPGRHSLVWSPPASLPNGTYFITLHGAGQKAVGKMIILR